MNSCGLFEVPAVASREARLGNDFYSQLSVQLEISSLDDTPEVTLAQERLTRIVIHLELTYDRQHRSHRP